MKSDYMGKVYDGRWEVVGFAHYSPTCRAGKYTLRNIYNQNEITVKDFTLRRIDREETTVSRVIHHKIKKESEGFNRWL